MRLMTAIVCIGVLLSSPPASADPWKDESGKGWRDRPERAEAPRRERRRRDVRIPYGHYPPPGECRTWYRSRPAGHQPPPHRC